MKERGREREERANDSRNELRIQVLLSSSDADVASLSEEGERDASNVG